MVIDEAYETFTQLALQIAQQGSPDPNAPPLNLTAGQNPRAELYRLMNDHPTLGPEVVWGEIMNIYKILLGNGPGTASLLAQLGDMVDSSWESCVVKPNLAAFGSFPGMLNGEPIYDQFGYITRDCLHSSLANLQDASGHVMQAVVGKIMAVQLKALVLLGTAWQNYQFYVETRLNSTLIPNIHLVRSERSTLFSSRWSRWRCFRTS